mmetsp:Transcript_9/g.16  ORF Transcript_9/g.16 Transcript_9/m.16 type:complete len:263 (+) Transcript_9:861-1649(+)
MTGALNASCVRSSSWYGACCRTAPYAVAMAASRSACRLALAASLSLTSPYVRLVNVELLASREEKRRSNSSAANSSSSCCCCRCSMGMVPVELGPNTELAAKRTPMPLPLPPTVDAPPPPTDLAASPPITDLAGPTVDAASESATGPVGRTPTTVAGPPSTLAVLGPCPLDAASTAWVSCGLVAAVTPAAGAAPTAVTPEVPPATCAVWALAAVRTPASLWLWSPCCRRSVSGVTAGTVPIIRLGSSKPVPWDARPPLTCSR